MERRTFLKAAATAGAAVAGVGIASAVPADAANPVRVAKYRTLVPEIFAPLADPPDFTEAVVIGSGFGGAVAAHRLARAGVGVTVLERGSRWPTDPFRQIFTGDALPDGRGFWHRTSFRGVTGLRYFFDDFGGVLDVTDYPGIQVWRGAAVGGGSVVYTGATVEPEKRFYDAVFGGTGVGWAEMHNVYYPRVRQNLAVSPMPDDVYADQAFTHSRIWDEQARRAGYTPEVIDGNWNWSIVRQEMRGAARPSAIIGESNLGNGNGVKQDLNQNYLKWAAAGGRATVYPGHQVTEIGRDTRNRYTVTVKKIDPTGAVLRTRTITCNRLFLGAGSIGTSELLVAARATGALPNLNEHVGQGWGTNGDGAIVRSLNLGGLTQGAPSRSRFLDESGDLPVAFENWYAPGVPIDVGRTATLGMVLDPTRGSFTYDSATRKVVLRWPGQPDAVAVMRALNRKIAAANLNVASSLWVAPDVNSTFTAHPLGGAVLGKATDSYGRVVGHPGLYVVDGAAVPGSTGLANPSLTISALAERNIEKIIAEGG